MTNALVPGANIVLELDTLAAIIAAAAYGIVLTLYIFTVLALVKSGDKYTTKKRIILLAYITLSLLLSTTAYVSSMLYIVETVFDVQLLNGRVRLRDAAWIYPLSILVTDAFMILRCVALYRGLSKKLRIFLMCVCGLMFILVGGLEWFKFILPKKFTQAEGILGFAFLSASLFANVTLSALISFRIIQLQRNNHEVLRVAQGSVYTRIVIMCIESCAMIVVFEVAYIVIYNIPPNQGANHGSLIPLLLIPHICAISSYLIICRVAQGLDVATQIDLSPDFPQTANRETSHPSTGLQFALSAHTQSDEDV